MVLGGGLEKLPNIENLVMGACFACINHSTHQLGSLAGSLMASVVEQVVQRL